MNKKKFKLFSKFSISTQFFINYMFIFVLLVIVVFATTAFAGYYLVHKYEFLDNDSRDLFKDTLTYDAKKAYELSHLPKGSYIEILDENLKIIDQYQSIHPVGYTYSKQKLYPIMVNEENSYQYYTFYYDTSKKHMVITYIPELIKNVKPVIINLFKYTILFFIVCLITVLFIYAKLTSISIVRPIKKLVQGVNTIANGNYNTRIHFKSKSELGQLKYAINEMAQKIETEIALREQSETKRQKLILDISHDLKTPLTNILGYSETLRENQNIDEIQNNKYLDVIISNGKKANYLIQNLFELSHVENAEAQIHMEKQDFCEFLRSVCISYIPELENHHISFDFDIPDEIIWCSIHAQKFERALSNIMNNAIKYSGRQTHIKISLHKQNDTLKLMISDTGPGIPTNLQDIIFDPFVRADDSRNTLTGGTGLGLAITKAIIKLHGGNISLDSTYTNGCRFIITLPIA